MRRPADGVRVDTTLTTATGGPEDRRVGYRMTCQPCQVAWTGDKAEPCWVCGAAGTTGPTPTLYPTTTG